MSSCSCCCTGRGGNNIDFKSKPDSAAILPRRQGLFSHTGLFPIGLLCRRIISSIFTIEGSGVAGGEECAVGSRVDSPTLLKYGAGHQPTDASRRGNSWVHPSSDPQHTLFTSGHPPAIYLGPSYSFVLANSGPCSWGCTFHAVRCFLHGGVGLGVDFGGHGLLGYTICRVWMWLACWRAPSHHPIPCLI